MTCGIYVLKFYGTEKVYVGQSVNIEKRYRNHIQRLKNGTHNYKMLEAYSRYGEPKYTILCETSSEELNSLEMEAFELFDSINNGFNISSTSDIFQEGENNGSSKYSNAQVYEVLEYLTDATIRYRDISIATGVSESSVRHIAAGDAHTWLKEKYPEMYKKMLSISGNQRKSHAGNAKSRKVAYPAIISPSGEVYRDIENANAFAREHGMDSSYFIKMLNGKALSCKGWKVLKNG